MLSRTADHLFWMARYTERAENTARMLDVNIQTSMLPQPAEAIEQSWRAILSISELQDLFDKKYSVLTSKNVLDFIVCDRGNPSSLVSCLTNARENARAVRGTLTTEMWETLNGTWIEVQGLLKDGHLERDSSQFFEWVKHRSHLSRGVTIGTMLKDEAFYFIRLVLSWNVPTTARILDVKFHGANIGRFAADPLQVESLADYYYWAAILRSLSCFEIYRKVYRDVITPARVAELMMIRGDMPRSLLACMDEVVANLHKVSNDVSGDTERLAGKLHADLKFGNIDAILADDLHAYLTEFLERIFELGNRISRDFLITMVA